MTEPDGDPVVDVDRADYAWDALSMVRRTAQVLRPLFASALESWSLEVVLTLWERLGEPLVTPFQFYLEEPSAFGDLGLHPRPLIAPLTRSDEDILHLALFDGKRARELRHPIRLGLAASVASSVTRPAREAAVALQVASQKRTDWERAIVMRADRVPARSPAVAFQSLDLITRGGLTRHTPRPVIGRYASRTLPRDSVLALSRGRLTAAVMEVLEKCDCTFLNVQGVRGRATLELIRNLARLLSNCPGLLIASAPSELFELADGGWPSFKKVHVVGEPIPKMDVVVLPVARDREQLDRRFVATTEGLAAHSALTARLFDIGKSAWWAAVRSLATDESAEPAVADYLRAIAAASQNAPDDAARFRSFTDELLAVIRDVNRAAERRAALSQAIAAGADTLLVPSVSARRLVQEGAPTLHVRCLTTREAWRAAPASHLAVLGLAGASSLDAILALRPTRISIVADPVEARVAVWFLTRWAALLRGAGSGQAALDILISAIEAVAAPSGAESGIVQLNLGNYTSDVSRAGPALSEPAVGELLRVKFVDGTNLLCPASHRFDVVSDRSNRLESRVATDLQPGDEVVMVAAAEARGFSDLLIDALDKGKLRDAFAQRRALLRLIRQASEAHSMGGRAITRALSFKGIRVSPEAVGAWLRGAVDDATVANTRRNLEALLNVLHVDVAKETLDVYWTAVRAVRVGHRLAGRQVVHAIRAAAAGRLGSQTMFRIESEYGWSIRELIEAAQALVVDEVERLDG